LEALAVWVLAGGIVLYLALDGGGYDIVVHSQVGIVVWWVVLVGAAAKLLPAAPLARVGWVALGLFGAFVAWTAVAVTWSLSFERSFENLSLVVGYLGVLVLGLAIHSDRARAVRHTVGAVAGAVVVVACLALASRLDPGLFHGAGETSSFVAGTQRRLSWPLNYWNALAALLALGLPLLLGLSSSARTLGVQAASAAALPVLMLCGYLTFSRGGAIAAAVAVLAFLALAPERPAKLATALVAAAGGVALIAGAVHRSALERGLGDAAARHQGGTLLVAIVLVCAGVAVAQVGIALAVRHGTAPRYLAVSPARARALLAAAILALVVAALAAGAPRRLSHAWRDFKHPTAPALTQDSLARYGAASGSGRYAVWRVAVDASSHRLLQGHGPGTFQLIWLPRAPYYLYVENAHSLYLETLSDVGVIGLALLVAFFVLAIGAAVREVVHARSEARVRAAALAAALITFAVSAAYDWIWQVPALPAAFLLLVAATLAPRLRRPRPDRGARSASLSLRAGAIIVAIACLVAIGIPLATTIAVRQSQAAVAQGNSRAAFADARRAARIEPGAATPQIQLALVLELRRDFPAAVDAARRAAANEPANWSTWLILSRLQAEDGHPHASLAAYLRARSLNPRSPLFQQ